MYSHTVGLFIYLYWIKRKTCQPYKNAFLEYICKPTNSYVTSYHKYLSKAVTCPFPPNNHLGNRIRLLSILVTPLLWNAGFYKISKWLTAFDTHAGKNGRCYLPYNTICMVDLVEFLFDMSEHIIDAQTYNFCYKGTSNIVPHLSNE